MRKIEIIKLKGIEYEKGLLPEEINKIEQIYGIIFPEDLKNMYMNFLPISKGFYLWRDFSYSNIGYIKSMLEKPFKEIENEIDDIEWSDNWGGEPLEKDKNEKIKKELKSAPKLIPIYFHRYAVSGKMETSPIFSVHGTDIIYYGENIDQYLEIEFAGKSYEEIDYKKIKQVPFWSDII